MDGDEPEFAGFENGLTCQGFPSPVNAGSGTRRKRDKCEHDDLGEKLPKRTKDMKKKGKKTKPEEVPLPDDSMSFDSSDDGSSTTQSKKQGQTNTDKNHNSTLNTKAISKEPVQTKTNANKSNNKNAQNNWIKNNSDTIFFIERQETKDGSLENSSYPRSIHPMELAKILHNCGIKEYRELKMAGRGRYRISFDRPRHAEGLINSKLLKEEFKFNIYVPNMMKESIGVVRSVPPSLSDAEILESIQAEKYEITKVERIQKRAGDKLEPTYSVKIFVKGQELPKQVTIFGIPAKVTVYVFPLRMCFNCCRYGHTAKTCKSKTPRCIVCTLEHDGRNCKAAPRCCHCAGQHKSNDPECPERIRQDKIRHLMASEKLTFIEAAYRFPKKQSVQHRLNSHEDFPLLPNSTTNEVNEIITNSPKQSHTQIPNNKHMDKIAQQIKQDLIKQLNLDTIMKKMKTIQDSIIKFCQQHKKQKDQIDTDILLINISDQIKEIIEPEVIARCNETIYNPNG